MSWIGMETLVILTVISSASASFMFSFQFHLAVKQSRGEAIVRGRECRHWTVLSLLVLFILHIVFFTISGILLVAGNVGSNMVVIAAASYVFYKLFISCYFFWGHWAAYRIFKTGDRGRLTSSDASQHIGRRLGLISTVNLASLIMALIYSLPVSTAGFGWILLIWMSTLMGLTCFLEVLAVPTGTYRNRQRQAQNGGGSPQPSAGNSDNADSMEDALGCPKFLSPSNWKTGSTASTSVNVNAQAQST
jgi:hypothetical protein